MKKAYLILAIFLTSWRLFGQQEQMYTQFMYNKQIYNPAASGSFVSPTLTTAYRQQWIGLDGAPNAQVVNYTQPLLNNRVGISGTIMRQQIAISTNLTFDVAYAYRVRMKRGVFAVGLQASMRNLRQNWLDKRIHPLSQNDPGIPTEPKNKFLPNFGAGVYYTAYNDVWYAGFSVPRLVRNSIDFAEFGSTFSEEVQHFNVMTGMTFKPNDDFKITPQALFRYAIGAPFDVELNTSVLVKNKFTGGLTYRAGGDVKGLGESLDALVGIQATENLYFCLSYDIGLTRLRKYNSGTIEAIARWWFSPPSNVTEIDPQRPF